MPTRHACEAADLGAPSLAASEVHRPRRSGEKAQISCWSSLLGKSFVSKSYLHMPEPRCDLLVVGLRAGVMLIPMMSEEFAQRTPAILHRLPQRDCAGLGRVGSVLLNCQPLFGLHGLAPTAQERSPKLIAFPLGPDSSH
jgi:hypothetical protein